MTKTSLIDCIKLKKEIKRIEEYIEDLPREKSKYTQLEYNVRMEYYKIGLVNLQDLLEEKKKQLSKFEKMKLVFK